MDRLAFASSVFLVLILAVDNAAEKVNLSSSSGLFWGSIQDEGDLKKGTETEYMEVLDHNDGIDGGFSSLDNMLQWAIGHSDPQKLKETAKDIQRQSASELADRQQEIRELMEKMKMPSDADLMKIAISDLNNISASNEVRHRALNELLILVEPLDNANDLHKLGGLVAVIRELNNSEPHIREISAWVLGQASQNNQIVQKQVLDLGALPRLMKMVKSSFTEESVKAFYAISALIRNNIYGQRLFYMESGDLMLQDIMTDSSTDIRLRRKSAFLVADLTESQLQHSSETKFPFLGNQLFLKSVVDLTMSTDLDLQEKALVAIKSLLQLTSTAEAQVFKDFCSLDRALEAMKEQLENLMKDNDHGEYARDIEMLRQEVELIFYQKLGKVTWVPT